MLESSTPQPENLTLPEVAKYLRCSTRTVQRLVEVGEGPRPIQLSERRLIFRRADVERWLESRRDS